MRRHTLKRAVLTGLGAYLALLVASLAGLPALFVFGAAAAVVGLSHWVSPVLILAVAGAEPVQPNDADPDRSRLFHACIEAAVDEGVALPRVFVGDAQMRHWVIASARTKFNPAVCVHPQLLDAEYHDVLAVGLRNELWAVRINLHLHGSLWTAACAFVLAVY